MDRESKPRENPKVPKIVCAILTVVTIMTILLGFYLKNPFIIICGIFPVAIYEATRTEGHYTRAGSFFILILVILEILAIKGFIKLNLSHFFGREETFFSGYIIPLGDIVFIFPAIASIISFVLVLRTWGIYTKWLAFLLLASSVALLYIVNKETLFDLLRSQGSYYY